VDAEPAGQQIAQGPEPSGRRGGGFPLQRGTNPQPGGKSRDQRMPPGRFHRPLSVSSVQPERTAKASGQPAGQAASKWNWISLFDKSGWIEQHAALTPHGESVYSLGKL